MDKQKHGERDRSTERVVKQTTHFPTLPKLPTIDWCQVRSLFFTLTALILLLAIGVWVGLKLGRRGSDVDVFINSGEGELSEKDRAQGVVEKKWTQVRVEKTSGHMTKAPPDEEESEESAAVLEFNPTNAEAIFGTDARAISFLFVSKKSGQFEKLLEEYRSAAHQLKGVNVSFTYVDVDSEHAFRIKDFFAVKGDVPAIRLNTMEGGRLLKYRPEAVEETGELRSSHIVDFIRAHLAGELKPYHRSEPTPADWDREAVKVLTGENFDRVVRESGKHVFVEFYASWCGHCKQLEPVWEELAERYRDNSSVLIAKIDAIANELPEMEVHAFPTMKLFGVVEGVVGEQQHKGIDYNGPRTVEGLSKFIDSHIA